MARPILKSGHNCWRVEHASRAAVIVDAADYYRMAKRAMMRAEHQIIMIGWDFDTRIFLDRDGTDDEDIAEAPNVLGRFVLWLADRRPDLHIYILRWDVGSLKMLGRGTTILTALRWRAHKRIDLKFDGAHPRGASHHQKILVIDDAFAFCGGIDMTGSRWDTRAHRPDHPDRKRPTTGRTYGPWHDATMAVEGAAARALGELARSRWEAAGGRRLPAPESQGEIWPRRLEPDFRDISVGIARTRGGYGELDEVRENEALFVDLIGSARRFIYAESQYFASRVVAEAIAARLAEPDGPEFVLVQPKSAEGWLKEEVMGAARAELMGLLSKADRYGRFRIYTPVNEAGEDIYVHAKVMIVDDRVLRVGSSNMNNRSMGLDSECDLVVDACHSGNDEATRAIRAVREGLMAEHLGVSPSDLAIESAAGSSLIDAVKRLRGPGRSLAPFVPPEVGRIRRGLAKHEVLDPESAEDLFEPLARTGLLARLGGMVRSSG